MKHVLTVDPKKVLAIWALEQEAAGIQSQVNALKQELCDELDATYAEETWNEWDVVLHEPGGDFPTLRVLFIRDCPDSELYVEEIEIRSYTAAGDVPPIRLDPPPPPAIEPSV